MFSIPIRPRTHRLISQLRGDRFYFNFGVMLPDILPNILSELLFRGFSTVTFLTKLEVAGFTIRVNLIVYV